MLNRPREHERTIFPGPGSRPLEMPSNRQALAEESFAVVRIAAHYIASLHPLRAISEGIADMKSATGPAPGVPEAMPRD